MKTFYFALLIILNIQLGFSQCKVKKDEFTGEALITFQDENKFVIFEARNGKFKIELKEQYEGQLKMVLPAGQELLLKLENGDIIKLISNMEAIPKSQAFADGVYTDYTYVCDIDKDLLTKMASSKVSFMKIPDGKGSTKDINCSSGFFNKIRAKNILKGAKCILGS